MKKCAFCANNNSDEAIFCASCGNGLDAINQPTQTINSAVVQQNTSINVNFSKNGTLISEDEYVVATLSNNKVQNIISGEGVKAEGAVLTNKRLYYTKKTGILSLQAQEDVVDVKDITGSKIANVNPLVTLIGAIFALVIGIFSAVANDDFEIFFVIFMPAAVLLSLAYLIFRKSHLKIEYAGGSISFSVKKYKKEKIQMFQKSIYIVKDNIDVNIL